MKTLKLQGLDPAKLCRARSHALHSQCSIFPQVGFTIHVQLLSESRCLQFFLSRRILANEQGWRHAFALVGGTFMVALGKVNFVLQLSREANRSLFSAACWLTSNPLGQRRSPRNRAPFGTGGTELAAGDVLAATASPESRRRGPPGAFTLFWEPARPLRYRGSSGHVSSGEQPLREANISTWAASPGSVSRKPRATEEPS